MHQDSKVVLRKQLLDFAACLCAGADIEENRRNRDDETRRETMAQEARDLVYGMLDCLQPIVTAVRGAAAGSGLALLLLLEGRESFDAFAEHRAAQW